MPTGAVLVVTRFIVPEEGRSDFTASASRLQFALTARPGHVRSQFAWALDDPARWVLVSEWEGVGAWRRALSAYDVRLEAVPLMALAEAEPSVYETSDG